MSVRAWGKALSGGLLAALAVLTVPAARAADQPKKEPSWLERTLSAGLETEVGLTQGLKNYSPRLASGLTRQQGRQIWRQAAAEAAKKGRALEKVAAITDGASRVGSVTKTAGKYLKIVDIAVDAGEIAIAGAKGGPEAAGLRAADVGLNEAAAYLGAKGGAIAGAKMGAWVGTLFGGPAGTPIGALIGGVVGGAGGAFVATVGYEYAVKPTFNEKIQKVIDEPNQPYPPPRGLKCTRLVVVPAGEVEAGATARFTALADTVVESGAALEEAHENTVVTGEAAWTFSGGAKTAQGQVATDCGMAGRTITATATYLGQTAVATVQVKPLPLVSLTVTASPASAPPGGTVTLTAQAVFKNAYCEETRTDPPGIEFHADQGASVAGSALSIDLDKEEGTVVAFASLPSEQRTSGGVPISVIPPVLERLSLFAPAAIDVCQPVQFKLYGYYSHKPEDARLLAPERATWSFSGRCTPLGTDTVRATWPGETIRATATTPEGQGAEAVVTVNPLPESSPWFPIEDVSSFASIKVGDTLKNFALEFACQGSRHVPRPSTAVEWSSDAPEILSCTPDGVCQGLEPGTATLTVTYGGRLITSRPVTVTEDAEATDEGYAADEEVSGDELEAAAAEPPKTGEQAESAPPDKKDTQAFKTGEKIGRLLAGALGRALEKKLNKDGEAPPGGAPPGGGSGSAPQGAKPPESSNDPFVGNWRLTLFRITGHSEGPDPSDIDEANAMAASMSATLSIRGSGGSYSVSGLPLRVTRITASGQTITIEGKDPTGKDDEVMRLTLRGNTLAGTYRITFAPDYSGRREWQTADIAFARQ